LPKGRHFEGYVEVQNLDQDFDQPRTPRQQSAATSLGRVEVLGPKDQAQPTDYLLAVGAYALRPRCQSLALASPIVLGLLRPRFGQSGALWLDHWRELGLVLFDPKNY
jgi:hypothetical protein